MDLLEDSRSLEKLAAQGLAPIHYEQAKEMADAVGAAGCFFMSAYTGENIMETMEETIKIGLNAYSTPLPEKPSKNCILQ
jgi:hypothetical protein